MWVFYLISLPLTLGMVIFTLKYFAGPDVPRYVFFTVGYAWFCSLSIIILVPADIWTTIIGHDKRGIAFFWSWSYWSTFALTWAVVPLIQGYEDAGDFTVKERLRTSIQQNLVFYLSVGSIGFFGLILLICMRRNWSGGIVGLAMACSNTFGLVTGAFLLGFGLSEIPKSIWRNADWNIHQKVLTHRVAKMAVKLDDAHQEFSNAIVIAQVTSNQMSKRDPLRPYMDVIDSMLHQMLRENPSFKPQGGRLGENDMDYDADKKSMATLRRQLRRAKEEYYRYKSEYMTFVIEALELEDTIKNYERRNETGWKYVSSFRPGRTGKLGSFFDTTELVWRCILRKQLGKLLAIMLGCMSAAILLAEATILPSGVDLSLFSILINSVRKQEVLVQITAFIPLMYMCICTYYSLFKIGMLMFYSLTPRQTSSVSLLMICSMVARYAPPISYNFLNLISLGGKAKTIFEKDKAAIEMKPTSSLAKDSGKGSQSKPLKEETWKYDTSTEATGNKSTNIKEQNKETSSKKEMENIAPNTVSLLDTSKSQNHQNSGNEAGVPSSRLSSTWESVKTGFQSIKDNIGAKRFMPLRQVREKDLVSLVSSSESLDEIFRRLKQPAVDQGDYSDEDDIDMDVISSGPTG
ncbi:PREDICTED: LMBR1 domain-containing protein 2 homolog A-like isoform X2 [Nelumbo nucifera]|uniref:LMBR1 domain-containing protein 2 homolog A-like isoform X2 n=1 Tax=Nelumbo nucifera TaxID=4432 RepID=A0A1U8AUV9_NELNU|nr:PREDICTED: LMBR1 domain-containing protein 2 homolog A-like isoform X2 [Nelumbo nucifera]